MAAKKRYYFTTYFERNDHDEAFAIYALIDEAEKKYDNFVSESQNIYLYVVYSFSLDIADPTEFKKWWRKKIMNYNLSGPFEKEPNLSIDYDWIRDK